MPPSSQSGLLQTEMNTFLVVQIYSAQMSLGELQDVPEFKGHSYFQRMPLLLTFKRNKTN